MGYTSHSITVIKQEVQVTHDYDQHMPHQSSNRHLNYRHLHRVAEQRLRQHPPQCPRENTRYSQYRQCQSARNDEA